MANYLSKDKRSIIYRRHLSYLLCRQNTRNELEETDKRVNRADFSSAARVLLCSIDLFL
jgi:hypothetical protein